MRGIFVILIMFSVGLGALMFMGAKSSAMVKGKDIMDVRPEGYPAAYFAGGCFWCVESEFRAIDGVLFTRSGYMGGDLDDPSYRDITTGKTGHAEVVEVTFDPQKTDYRMLSEFFLAKAHDPTQLNRQGVDVGTQYRSAIFPVDEEQERIAKEMIEYVDKSKLYAQPIVTTLEPFTKFWEAEEYHQQYYEKYEESNGVPHIRVMLKKDKKR